MTREDVRPDGLVEQLAAVREIDLPESLPELGERVTTPDVVHEHVQSAMVAPHAIDQSPHIVLDSVIAAHGNALPTSRRHELGGLVDRLGTIGTARELTKNRPARAVHGRSLFAQRHGNSASRPARRARDQRDSILEPAQSSLRHGRERSLSEWPFIINGDSTIPYHRQRLESQERLLHPLGSPASTSN